MCNNCRVVTSSTEGLLLRNERNIFYELLPFKKTMNYHAFSNGRFFYTSGTRFFYTVAILIGIGIELA
jgi:hypothetical protein